MAYGKSKTSWTIVDAITDILLGVGGVLTMVFVVYLFVN